MEFPLFSIIVAIFAVFAMSRALFRMRDRELTARDAIFWLLFWVFAFIFSLLPWMMTPVAQFFGIGRGVDLFVYTAIVLIFYLIFRLYVRMDNLNAQMTKIIRATAKEHTHPGKRGTRGRK